MKFTDIFVRRPVLASVVSIMILILGLRALFELQVRQYPKIENTVITVTTTYSGASASLIQGFITSPIEKAVASVDGIDYISAQSVTSTSTISIYLKPNVNADAAFTQVMSQVNSVQNQLPQDADQPVIAKQKSDSVALLYISYSSNELTSPQIYDYLSRVIQPKLQTVQGVGSASILGGNPFAMRVWLNPIRMAALHVTASDVSSALTANNYQTAAGQTKGVFSVYNISAKTDINTVKDFKNIVVKGDGDTLIHLEDIAKVELGSEDYSSSVIFNGKRGVFMAIQSTASANPLSVIKDVRKVLPELTKDLPPSLKQNVVYDATHYINASIQEVIKTIIEATAIVIVVIFLFLGSLRSVVIPVITIPLSLIGVCSLMLIFGYSINLLTLFAMVLAIGLVVDDAIIVVENVHRHIEEGKQPFDAALIGAREIASPVIAMTITLAAVYAPIAFVGGITGALFKEFALTLAAAVIVSGVIALTLSPMMCSKLLVADNANGGLAHWLDRQFLRLQQRYERILHHTLEHRPVVLTFGLIILVGIFGMLKMTQKQLAPHEDQGFLITFASAPKYANINYVEKYSEEFAKIYKSFPAIADYFIINTTGAGTFPSQVTSGAVLKPWRDRSMTTMQLQPLLQHKLNQITGLQAQAIQMPALPGPDGMPIQFVLTSTADYSVLNNVMTKFKAAADKSGLFLFSSSDLKFNKPKLNIAIDRAKAAQMGITMQQIGSTLSTLLSGGKVNYFSLDGRSYKVIPQLADNERLTPQQLNNNYIKTAAGALIPLSTLITLSTSIEPGTLNQFQQLNSATLSAVAMPGHTDTEALNFLKAQATKLMPKGMSYNFSGQSRTLVQEGNALIYTFFFALIMIFLVLAAQFESFRDPFIIMFTVPMAIFGAAIPMAFGWTSLNIYTEIGLVTLIGLITKHGILMVQFANDLQEQEGRDIRSAIEHAAGMRLRPILMTTAAMVVGVLPLIIASGAGAVSRHDLGLVIAMGLLIGTLFTLFVIPTMYTYLTKQRTPNTTKTTKQA
ncbi:Efflux pump membrane transporter BepE [Piscirickettsia salmonis]|uniref:efflux RND transporter permease subunit n=1 Tax=Piscirickettsia salmonis TaxID=1238 RepID=UPI0012B99FFA|nr:efflux RND transporter permease subunit [Piscirickettsia salmonis]QGO22032.1 Efflux pump membrane transporter BepE [Piscirickettsia salmonis]